MKRLLKAALGLMALAALVWVFCPTPDLYGDIPFSTAVYDQHGKLLRLNLAADGRYRLFTPLADMAPAAVQGTLLYEDQYFYRHPGVNPSRLLRAFWTTYVRRTRREGASTSSMQLARIRFGIDSDTLARRADVSVRSVFQHFRDVQSLFVTVLDSIRADLVIPGCAIFAAIHTLWPCTRLRVADRGLREGMLRELMLKARA